MSENVALLMLPNGGCNTGGGVRGHNYPGFFRDAEG